MFRIPLIVFLVSLVMGLNACAKRQDTIEWRSSSQVAVPQDASPTVKWALGASVPGQPTQQFHERTAVIRNHNGYVSSSTEERAGSRSGTPFTRHSFGGGYGYHYRSYTPYYGGW